MSGKPTISLILERIGSGNTTADFRLWACRGEGRGCARNKHRTSAKHCDDCVATIVSETLEELQSRLDRGDA